jgi:hypothetical protein
MEAMKRATLTFTNRTILDWGRLEEEVSSEYMTGMGL